MPLYDLTVIFFLLPKWLVTVSRQEGQDHSVSYVCDTLCGFLNWGKLLKVIFSIHFCPYVFIILFFKITSEASQWKYRYTSYIGAQIHLSMIQSLPLMHYLFKNKIKHLNSFKPVYYFLLQLMGSVGCIHSAVNIGIPYDIKNRKIGPRS